MSQDENELTTVQVTKKTLRIIKDLATEDYRTSSGEVQYLVESEMKRRQKEQAEQPPAQAKKER